MKRIKATSIIFLLVILIFTFTSCTQMIPDDLKMPSEDCVMVYTISENEYIRILCDSNSQFNYYGEWVKGDITEAVRFAHYVNPFTYSGDGLICDIKIFDPSEKDHGLSGPNTRRYEFEKGAMNSSYLIDCKTEEKIPITFSIDKNVDFYFSWVSQTYIDFFNTNNKIYKEESQNFWYDFGAQKGEWTTNGKTIPIRMEFNGITPQEIVLYIYDIKEPATYMFYVIGEITDENTFIGTEISGTMFDEGTVSEIKVVKTDSES